MQQSDCRTRPRRLERSVVWASEVALTAGQHRRAASGLPWARPA